MLQTEPLGPRDYDLGPLLPLFNALKEHLLARALTGTCTPEEAITLDELTGKCPAAPLGWSYVSGFAGRDGVLRVAAGIETLKASL